MRMRAPALALTGLLALGGVAACSEQEQAETEQQVEDGAERVGEEVEEGADRVEEEVDEQTDGG